MDSQRREDLERHGSAPVLEGRLVELSLQLMGLIGDRTKLFQRPAGPQRDSLTGPGPRLSPGHSELSLS